MEPDHAVVIAAGIQVFVDWVWFGSSTSIEEDVDLFVCYGRDFCGA
tara:strand:+ start:717 stop:854 length:138 start_codon:yes stop_codon:yes gene_type:complete